MKIYNYKIKREFVRDIADKKVGRPSEAAIVARESIDFERDQEHLIVMFLNGRMQIKGSFIASIGSLDASIVHPRDIFKSAILASASTIIIAHNHPSGDPTPSMADIQITKRIKDCGTLMGIQLIDSIIVTETDSYSMKEHGNM